jgi:hypothetical protein
MLAGPEIEKRVMLYQASQGREQKWRALLQVILVNKSNRVSFFP